ncbi:unnamed protein product [Dibothriocephalus latus]|uniref:XRCC4 coiled-coil domain-containing protein n=1 Tax=Dibothriocephalus latus TaxID=60516 RepID=A0A3P7ND90_DIBLA|nr:unnamed protein product [Dibothriocephalus latus]
MPTLSIRTVGEATLVIFSNQPDCFRICAVADANYWEASFDLADVVRQFPTKNSSESADYMSDLVAAFDDQTNQTVSFALSTAGPEVRVTWSQSLADGLKVIRGEFCLKKAGSLEVGVPQILSLCKDCLSSQRQEISNLRKENSELRSVAETAVQKYSDVVVEVSRKEEHLYAVFAALLNTKKAKIRTLEEASSPTTAKKKEADSPPSTMEVDSPPEAPKTEDGDFASVPQLSTKGLAEKLSKNSPRKPRTARAKKPLPAAVVGEDISLDDLA